MPGVVRTRVGYAGGQKKNPTYHSIGDHTETTQMDFDPAKTSYAELLDIFWHTHNPCRAAYSRQYMSAIFYHNDEQKKLAFETKAREEARRGNKIETLIVPATEFYLAEDYHQKYVLRSSPDLMEKLNAVYPKLIDFVNSTAAARLNGYLSGYGKFEDVNALGLTAEQVKRVRERAR